MAFYSSLFSEIALETDGHHTNQNELSVWSSILFQVSLYFGGPKAQDLRTSFYTFVTHSILPLAMRSLSGKKRENLSLSDYVYSMTLATLYTAWLSSSWKQS